MYQLLLSTRKMYAYVPRFIFYEYYDCFDVY